MTRLRVCLLCNTLGGSDVPCDVARYLPPDRFDVQIADRFPENPQEFVMIVPWNYCQVIVEAETAGNVVVFHASDLPDDRGWAPIYHAFADSKCDYVLCGILAAHKVDTGDILIRARLPIQPGYTAPFLRQVDSALSLLLIERLLSRWPDGRMFGLPQQGMASYHSRRTPADSGINPSETILALMPHLRGVEPTHPAFFDYEGVRYCIEIAPMLPPALPAKVTIEYPALGVCEEWTGWA